MLSLPHKKYVDSGVADLDGQAVTSFRRLPVGIAMCRLAMAMSHLGNLQKKQLQLEDFALASSREKRKRCSFNVRDFQQADCIFDRRQAVI